MEPSDSALGIEVLHGAGAPVLPSRPSAEDEPPKQPGLNWEKIAAIVTVVSPVVALVWGHINKLPVVDDCLIASLIVNGSLMVVIWLLQRRSKTNFGWLRTSHQGMLRDSQVAVTQLRDEVRRLTGKLQDVENRNQDLNAQILAGSHKTQPIRIEGMRLPSLEADLEDLASRTVQNVQLDDYSVHCRWKGKAPVWDAEVTYRLEGKNLAAVPLSQLSLPISGDNQLHANLLNATFYDLEKDPDRKHPMKPLVRHPEAMCKVVVFEFADPWIGHFQRFSVELSFTWSALFAASKNYWYMQTLDFRETHSARIRLDLGALANTRVQAYRVDKDSHHEEQIGRIYQHSPAGGGGAAYPQHDPAGPPYEFSTSPPKENTIYVLLVDVL